MKTLFGIALLFAGSWSSQAQFEIANKNKKSAINDIERNVRNLAAWSQLVWEYAEPSLQEEKSSELIKNILKEEGFTIQENVSGFKTVFIATFGNKQPVIGLFGEYDADPGASNKVVPRKEELVVGGYGHGGHHNLLGVGSLGAALAIKNLIKQKKLNCTIRYYGTTAEGGIGTKSFLARDGYFNDLDLSLYWHPSPVTVASTSAWDARFDLDVTFSAKSFNVLREETGEENTLSASEYFIAELHEIRAGMNAGKKINYIIQTHDAGLHQIADTARFKVRVQTAKQEDAITILNSVREAVRNVQSKTQVQGVIHVVDAKHQFLPNVTAMKTVYNNMKMLEPEIYSDHDQEFVKDLQHYLSAKGDGIHNHISDFEDLSKREEIYGYSSDIGDASWIAPEIYFIVRTLPPVAMHQWTGTVFSGHTIGHKGMIRAAKILSMTIIDFVENKDLQNAIRKDFLFNTKNYKYTSFLNAQY